MLHGLPCTMCPLGAEVACLSCLSQLQCCCLHMKAWHAKCRPEQSMVLGRPPADKLARSTRTRAAGAPPFAVRVRLAPSRNEFVRAAAAGPGIAGAPAGHCTGRTRHAQRNVCRASHAGLPRPRVRPPRPGSCSKPVRPRPLRGLLGPAGARAGQGAAAAARPRPATRPADIRIAIVRQRKQG